MYKPIYLLITLLVFSTVDLPTTLALQTGGASLGSNQKAQIVSWTRFAPKDAGFTVLLPSAPKEAKDNSLLDSVSVPTVLYSANADGVKYFVGRIGDMPEKLVEKGRLDEWFNHADEIYFEYKTKDGKSGSTLKSQKDISLDGYAGREYEADCGPYNKTDTQPCIVRMRVYKVGHSIFVIGLSGPTSILSTEHINKFLQSFTLTPQVKSTVKSQ